MRKFNILLASLAISSTLIPLTNCTQTYVFNEKLNLSEIETKGHLNRFEIHVGRHTITGWKKIESHATNYAYAKVYIEGDGRAWINKSQASPDPTPRNPVALKLASFDPYPVVIYLARPCQFTKFDKISNQCNRRDWTTERYSEDVIQNYMNALNSLKMGYAFSGFELIGYSGGANISGLIAARRNDVISLRTVAGNVDNDAFTALHNVSSMPHALNMADHAYQLAHIPQIHFVGSEDSIVPESIARSYESKMGAGDKCSKIQIVHNADHGRGWEEQWGKLLSTNLPCKAI